MDARAQAGARLDWTGSDGSDGLDQMDAFHVGRALASSLLQVLRGRGVAAQVHTIEFPRFYFPPTGTNHAG